MRTTQSCASVGILLLGLSCLLLDATVATRVYDSIQLTANDVGGPRRSQAAAGQLGGLHESFKHNAAGSGGSGAHAAAPGHQAGQQLPQHSQPSDMEDAHVLGTSSGHVTSSRHLSQVGPVYADIPDDLQDLGSILAAARDSFPFFGQGMRMQPMPNTQTYNPRSRSLGGVNSRSPGSIGFTVTFASSHADVPVRLPNGQRSFNMTVRSLDGSSQQACSFLKLPYLSQNVGQCQNMAPGTKWLAELVDADAADLVLASYNFTVGPTTQDVEVPVELGLLSVETSFDKLAWSGMYSPRPRHSTSTVIIHAVIVGAQVVVYTRQGGREVVWDVQWTGSDGSTSFFLVPEVHSVFWANMSVGDTVLQTVPLTLDAPLSVYDGLNFDGDAVTQVQQQQITAASQLLCTGEVEEVRGDAGTFPQSLSLLQPSIYHPKGFVCRWELLPNQPDVLLSVDYRGLLPDESITLELSPNNIIRLETPDGGPGAVFQASAWVDSSILVSFQSTRTSTDRVGAFSISWTSVASSNKGGLLDSKTMVIVLSCVSAAGALLAACCFYFVCCGRRRRAGGVVVDSEGAGGVSLMRVPSAVRELLPHKPYQAPEANPLPGAEVEPDCCSICLVELESGEQVTVLPCMHFYHKECIGSWLKRNCTCPLCKNNVLEAFKVQQYEARQARRNRRRGLLGPSRSPAAAAAATAGSSGSSDGRHSSSSGSRQAGDAAAQQQQQQHVEMTAVQHVGAAAWPHSRSPSPWPPLDGSRASTPAGGAAAAGVSPSERLQGEGDAVVALSMLPVGSRPGCLPPLLQPALHTAAGEHPHHSSTGSWLLSLTSAGHPAAAAAAPSPPSVIIPPSPSPSMISLQSGTVLATPEDFAPAAAAAAAHIASPAASRQRSTSPTALADAAQASVAALRASSRNLGRRLQVLLSPSAAATTGDAPAATAAAGGSSSGPSSPQQQGPHPGGLVLGTLPPTGPAGQRVAVSIYAYAGHPTSADQDLDAQQQQQQSPHAAITVLSLPGSVEQGSSEQQQRR